MRADLDRLMTERNLDAMLVEGPDGLSAVNSDYNYFVGGRKIVGLVLKKRGEAPMLVYAPMEQQQAEQTGLTLIPRDRWNMRDILRETGDAFLAQVQYRRRMFTDLGIRGRLGVYGVVRAGQSFAVLAALSQQMPDLELVAEFERDLISAARMTKDADEIAILREAGRRTAAVVAEVRAFISQYTERDGVVVQEDGAPLTIGDVHQFIRRAVAAQGMDMPYGFIFAQGRDAGHPHATGTPEDSLRTGVPIVFDIYPRLHGYYHDMTRTLVVGHVPPAVQQAYDDVLGALEAVEQELEAGAPTFAYQQIACEYLEARGHKTVLNTFPLSEGMVHSLGHGLGMELHEDLKFAYYKEQDRGDLLVPGAVVTIEPGVYYPEQEIGVRIEDVYYCNPDGTFENLTPHTRDALVPLRNA